MSRFAEARQAIKRQAIVAAEAGLSHVSLHLSLPASAAEAGEDYLRALDEADAYCRAARLLTLETQPQHRVFRQWYVGEIVKQLRAAADGEPATDRESFEQRLLREIDTVALARRATERVARLFDVSAALGRAATTEAVAQAVVEHGVAALGASGGGILLAGDADRLSVPATVGYDEDVVARLRAESRDAELPAAVALRTGESVWLESREDRDSRFPLLSAARASGRLRLRRAPRHRRPPAGGAPVQLRRGPPVRRGGAPLRAGPGRPDGAGARPDPALRDPGRPQPPLPAQPPPGRHGAAAGRGGGRQLPPPGRRHGARRRHLRPVAPGCRPVGHSPSPTPPAPARRRPPSPP